jgi:protocatechuate 3,4-dioxygenase beta subunit
MRALVAILVGLLALALELHAQTGDPPRPASQETRFTVPPGAITPGVRRLFDRADAALRAGTPTSDILSDPAYVNLHEWPPFRDMIRRATRASSATIVVPSEPGRPLVVEGRVLGRDGKPVPGALVYVYHTSAKGWYSDRAAHYAVPEGDRRHARLFGYLLTGPDGRFELRTIRPAGYTDSDLPAHIHVEITPPAGEHAELITEILFENDPRLTPESRRRAAHDGFQIARVQADGQGRERVSVEFRLRS